MNSEEEILTKINGGNNQELVSFEARALIKLVYDKKSGKVQHSSTDVLLTTSKNIDQKKYFWPNGLPNKDGVKAISNAFIQGLLNNIHAAHHYKHRDSAEHLKWIISELERGFIEVTDVQEKNYGE